MGIAKRLHVESILHGVKPPACLLTSPDKVSPFEFQGSTTDMGTTDHNATTATELTIYDRSADPAAFLDKIGDAIFKSGMFGCETPAQGRVLALECASRRLPPLSLAEKYHLIKGKLSMKADAMLAGFMSVGGTYHIVERSADRAAITMERNGEKMTFELTWQEAQQEPFVYVGKEDDVVKMLADGKTPKTKAKYATPRARAQMMWARVVSDSVRVMAPDVVAGHYTEEEIGDFDYVATASSKGKAAKVEVVEDPQEDVQDADIVVASVAEASEAAESMGKTIRLQTDEVLAGVKAAAEQDEINRTKAAAEAKIEASKAEEQRLMQGHTGSLNAPAGSTPLVGKATPSQIERVKALVVELGVDRAKLQAMLTRVGAAKVAEMSAAHCQGLIDVLERERAKRGQQGNGHAGQASPATK